MYTTKFEIEDYLAEYLIGKWGVDKGDSGKVVELPRDIYLYTILHSLTIKKPKHAPVPSGNVEIVIPQKREGNKKPERYNYISSKAAKYFNRRVKAFFRADLHEFVDHWKHVEGDTYKNACFLFVAQYQIESIDPDSLSKNYYRWKGVVRDNREKRAYSTR